MSQVGHADSNMTLDVYAQLEQRIEWSHGTEFDRLVRNARELHGARSDMPAERCAAPTSRSRGWPTPSTSSG